MADTDLEAIQTKVRRLTRSPSTSQITTNQLNQYINTFVLYDFPAEVKLQTLREVFTFYTEPNIDLYDSSNTDFDPNVYVSVHPPVYIAGYFSTYYQSREQFFIQYPINNLLENIGTGDSSTTNYTGTLSNIPVLRNYVTFSSIDANNNGLEIHDDGAGNLIGDVNPAGTNTIDYVTGVYDLTFANAPGSSEDVDFQGVPYVATRPFAVLYFENAFQLRPVPDKVYRVDIEVFKQPSELLTGNSPELKQWWQYIAYGAAKKIFEDRMDMESVASIMPEFKKQESLVLRKTLQQNKNQRTATIYTEQVDYAYGGFFNRGRF